jgi:Zn-dependent peptidase ImmA (M78 family)
MADHLRHGFKLDAERIAISVREELEISPIEAFDCMKLCNSLGIPMIKVTDLVASGASTKSVSCILSPSSKFSAMTVTSGTKRLIVYNPQHPIGRRANSLAHELSHILLEHPLLPALGTGGCRHWDPVLEAEADWQASALLVPRQGALNWVKTGRSLEEGANYFGVSLSLFRWRVNQTGVMKQVSASSAFRRSR